MTPPSSPVGGADSPRQTINWSVELAEHERWLRTVVLARLGEPQAVNKVMQEVSLAAVRGQAPPDDPNRVAPWLYGLAVRQALLYRRKQGRRRKMVQRFVERFRPTEQDARTADPLDWLLTDERRKIVAHGAETTSSPRCRDSAAQIHRELELQGTGRPLGRERKRRRGSAASRVVRGSARNWRRST